MTGTYGAWNQKKENHGSPSFGFHQKTDERNRDSGWDGEGQWICLSLFFISDDRQFEGTYNHEMG